MDGRPWQHIYLLWDLNLNTDPCCHLFTLRFQKGSTIPPQICSRHNDPAGWRPFLATEPHRTTQFLPLRFTTPRLLILDLEGASVGKRSLVTHVASPPVTPMPAI